MAQHKIKMVEQKELNDQFVSFRYRCCEDESTDSWHTLGLGLTEAEVQEATTGFKAKVAAQHDQKVSFRKGNHAVNKASVDATVTV